MLVFHGRVSVMSCRIQGEPSWSWVVVTCNLQLVGEAHMTLKGLYLCGVSFTFGCVVCKFVASKSTRSSLWNV